MAKEEIIIIKEDIKKDLTNFLIAIAEAGISTSIFPQLSALITKSLSPTLDIGEFTIELLELLKKGNEINNGAGLDFGPLFASLDRTGAPIEEDGEVFEPTSELEGKDEELVPTVTTEDNFDLYKKVGATVNNEGTEFISTSNLNNKVNDGDSDFVNVSPSGSINSLNGNPGDSIVRIGDPINNEGTEFTPTSNLNNKVNDSDSDFVNISPSGLRRISDDEDDVLIYEGTKDTVDEDEKVKFSPTGSINSLNGNPGDSIVRIGDPINNGTTFIIDVNDNKTGALIYKGTKDVPVTEDEKVEFSPTSSINSLNSNSGNTINNGTTFTTDAINNKTGAPIVKTVEESLAAFSPVGNEAFSPTSSINSLNGRPGDSIVRIGDPINNGTTFTTDAINNKTGAPIVKTVEEHLAAFSPIGNEAFSPTGSINSLNGRPGDSIVRIGDPINNGTTFTTDANDNKESEPLQVTVEGILEFAVRTPTRQKQLDLLLYNLIPYGLLKSLADIRSVWDVPKKIEEDGIVGFAEKNLDIANLISGVDEVDRLIRRVKYFTVKELVFFTSGIVNFYTLMTRRGYTIKDMRGVDKFSLAKPFVVGSIEKAIYAGSNKLRVFGSPPKNIVAGELKELATNLFPGVTGFADSVKNAENKIAKLTNNPKEYNFSDLKSIQNEIIDRKNRAGGAGKSGRKKIQSGTTRTVYDFGLINPDDVSIGGLTDTDTNIITTLPAGNYVLSHMDHSENSSDLKNDSSGVAIEIKPVLKKLEGKESSSELKKKHEHKLSHMKHSENSSDLKKKHKRELSHMKHKEDPFKLKEGMWEIGSVYVSPAINNDNVDPKWIPFQFNPTITESGMAARYTSVSILSRIGNLQSYTGTDSLSVTVSTSYAPITNDDNELFNLKDIQLIELSYRSLTLPWFSNQDETSGYKYYKPPLIKIVMGEKSKVNSDSYGRKISTEHSPFSNLLTYPENVLNGENSNGNLIHFRSFIATNVAITRGNQLPYFMERQKKDGSYILKDTMGYNISMNLIEVTSSYHQILPNFRDYYDVSFKSRG